MKSVTDDFVETMQKPGAIDCGGFCTMVHLAGLPEGVDPRDPRVIKIVEKIDALFEDPC
jgi:hypothetical protein